MNAVTEAQAFARSEPSEPSEQGQQREQRGPIELRDDERQRCEVWTRVMGYHRPVASFNTGKKGEHHERVFFTEGRAGLR